MEEKNKKSQGKKYLGIREIAKMAGVSTATVSRVMNHPEKCSAKTIEKVTKIIEDNHYIPNDTIKSIFANESNIIAVFIQDINNPFYTKLVLEINELCFENNYMLLICDTEDDQNKEKAYLEYCIAKRCAGIILTEGYSWEIFKNADVPVVFFDRGRDEKSVYVASDNYESARKVVNYLCNLGHEKIAFVGAMGDFESVQCRYRGYRDELKARGVTFEQQYVYGERGYMCAEMGRNALRYFLSLEEPPTAIFCACDILAFGVVNAAQKMNIKIPEQLSVCGFDHVMDDYFYVQLTTVEQDVPGIAKALFEEIINYQDDPRRRIVKSKFIYGETCARVQG